MNIVVLTLAGLAITGPASGRLPETVRVVAPPPAQVVARKTPAAVASSAGVQDADAAIQPPQDAAKVAAWVAESGDNHALPYAIIDKKAAALLLFDGKGKPLGQVPVLLGVALGDEATPGIGSKNLSEIGPAEKTTPAGRFLAKFGVAAGKQRVLWVDYATSVALHPIPRPGKPKEKRRERLLSATSDDNRITFGCINVPQAFYGKSIQPLFQKKGGYVYVTPDNKPLEEVFPRLRVQAVLQAGAS